MLNVIVIILIVVADQVSKYYAENLLASRGAVSVIPGILDLTYVRNTGAAWGMLKGARWFFVVLTVAICVLIFYWLFKKNSDLTGLARVSLLLIAAGAIGNMIDRLFLAYVRDMIYISCINFPVFNVADSAVTVGAILFVLDIIVNREKAFFNLLDRKEKKQEKTGEDGA